MAQRQAGWPGSPQGPPSGWSLFSSTSLPRDQVCQGRREAWAASLLVCVVGVVCVYFLVFGLMIAVLLPRVGSTWGPTCSHFVLLPTGAAAQQPGVSGGERWRCRSGVRARQAELAGWMGCRYVAYRDIYFIMGGGAAPPGTGSSGRCAVQHMVPSPHP